MWELDMAAKKLEEESVVPSLGMDAKMPQFRPERVSDAKWQNSRPRQAEWPIYYFFYGTLMKWEVLGGVLGRDESDAEMLEEKLLPALVYGGKLRTWGGKYKALVDGGPGDMVEGKAFCVEDEEDEEASRQYEMAAYEVVRCKIELKEKLVRGCTFRFRDVSKLDAQLDMVVRVALSFTESPEVCKILISMHKLDRLFRCPISTKSARNLSVQSDTKGLDTALRSW